MLSWYLKTVYLVWWKPAAVHCFTIRRRQHRNHLRYGINDLQKLSFRFRKLLTP